MTIWKCIWETGFIYGITKALWDSIHCLYDKDKITYAELLIMCRKAETEILD